MGYTVYILQSKKTSRYYIGSTADVGRRLFEHNSGKSKSTRNRGPYVLVYVEDFRTKQEAYRREMQIKRYKGGEAFKNLLKS